MQNVKPIVEVVDQWTADLFSNFTGVSIDESRDDLILLAEDFIEVINSHFEGTSLNNSAEEIADHYMATN